jgi:RimJ/RimL family protein N-acetyltransferase
MNIRSLGYRTDLIFPAFDGEIIDRGNYTVIRTPTCANFYWGNFLLFDAPPTAASIDTWPALFADEIGTPPTTNHIAFGWDTVEGETGDNQPFIDAGYELSENVILAASTLDEPPHPNREIAIRRFTETWEWEAATVLQVLGDAGEHGVEGYTLYSTRQMARYRKMQDAGIGAWFGAFLGDTLVGSLGVFRDGPIARYQHVDIHPDHRRQGICGTLVHAAGQYAFDDMGAKTLVMIADENYHAARIYESVGFKPAEHQRGLTWWRRATE